MFGAILKCSKKAKVLEIITGIYAQENANIKVSSWLLKERSVFSVKKKGIKNTKKSFSWSGFSKIGLQLVR